MPTTYRIEFTAQAKRQYQKLSEDVREQIRPRLQSLTGNPRPAGCVKLTAPVALYRIRIGNYRLIYEVRDQVLVVVVVAVGHRSEVYRRG